MRKIRNSKECPYKSEEKAGGFFCSCICWGYRGEIKEKCNNKFILCIEDEFEDVNKNYNKNYKMLLTEKDYKHNG